MAETRLQQPKETEDLHQYADGWISERKGTGVPAFLKFAYIAIAAGVVAYFLMYMNGEVNHSDRGVLVRQFNAATQSAPGLMYAIIAMVVIYALVVVGFAFKGDRKS